MTFRPVTAFLNRTLLALLLVGLLTSQGKGQANTSLTRPVSVVDTQGGVVPGAAVILNTRDTDQETTGITKVGGTERDRVPKGAAPDQGKCDGRVCPISKEVKSLPPSLPGRFARGFQYDYKLLEQPGTVLVSSGAGAGAITAFLRNPEHYLQQHTVTFKFAELFPDRLSIFTRGSDYLKKHPEAADKQLSEILCGKKPLITCLTQGGSWWQRALMGTSVNMSLSERAAVQQGVIVISPVFGKHYQVNGGFTFDPAKLFPTATNWKSTFDDIQKIDKTIALLGAGDVISDRQPWKQPWAVLIPKVEFKILSQFDFLKFQGALIAAPFPERALNTWTFTWDLTRAIPDMKRRTDADAIGEAWRDLKDNLGREKPTSQKRCILIFDQEVREVKDLHPASRAESCQQLARILKAKKYRLSCVLQDKSGDKERQDGPERDPSELPAKPQWNSCRWGEP